MITPKGKLLFVRINGHEDTFNKIPNGKWAATIELSEKDWEDMKAQVQARWESSKEYKDVMETVDNPAPNLQLKKKKNKVTGEVYHTLKASAYKMQKKSDGTEVPRVIIIRDGSNVQLPDDTPILDGAEGRLKFYTKPYNAMGKYGVHLYLQEIQVTKAASGEEFPTEDDEEEPF